MYRKLPYKHKTNISRSRKTLRDVHEMKIIRSKFYNKRIYHVPDTYEHKKTSRPSHIHHFKVN